VADPAVAVRVVAATVTIGPDAPNQLV